MLVTDHADNSAWFQEWMECQHFLLPGYSDGLLHSVPTTTDLAVKPTDQHGNADGLSRLIASKKGE